MRAIQVEHASAELVEPVGDLRRGGEDMVAERVAEQERHAACRVGTKRIGPDPDRRLPGVVERELRLVGLRLRWCRYRKAGGLVVNRRDHRALTSSPRRQRTG